MQSGIFLRPQKMLIPCHRCQYQYDSQGFRRNRQHCQENLVGGWIGLPQVIVLLNEAAVISSGQRKKDRSVADSIDDVQLPRTSCRMSSWAEKISRLSIIMSWIQSGKTTSTLVNSTLETVWKRLTRSPKYKSWGPFGVPNKATKHI